MTLERLAELIELRFQQQEAMFDAKLVDLEARLEARLEAKLDAKLEALEARLEAKLDAKLDAKIGSLRAEMLERFQAVDDRFNTLELRMQQLTASMDEARAQLVNVRSEVERLSQRMYANEDAIYHLSTRVDHFGEDMRLRFKSVNERLAAVEQKLAA